MATATLIVLSLALGAGSPAQPQAAAPATISLPAPQTQGGMPLDKALATRRSVRTLAATPLPLAQVSQLLWAAQGVTDAKGHRTAPSAIASYPLELFLVAGAVEGLAPGIYRYLPANHALERVASGDKRAALVDEAIGQKWIKDAPAIFVVANRGRPPERLANRAERFALIETGLAAQNLLLETVSLGLGATFVGGFDPQAVRKVLGAEAPLEPTAVLPVGKPSQAPGQ